MAVRSLKRTTDRVERLLKLAPLPQEAVAAAVNNGVAPADIELRIKRVKQSL